jgi:hypothetical protein
LLYLLRDHQGRPLLIAEAASKAAADTFGRHNLPDFCGESLEMDSASRGDAEEFWGVRTVRVGGLATETAPRKLAARAAAVTATTMVYTWVRGPRLPEEVESAGLLTPEDLRDLTLDHIARTSDVVAHVEIRRRAQGGVR